MRKGTFAALLSLGTATATACCGSLLGSACAAAPPRAQATKATERVWPAAPGEAAVCLWADDKLAAFSITIDDNSAPDVEWWLAKSAEMSLPLTWFLITDRVGTGFGGSWNLWKKVRDAGHAGHAIESHTVTHFRTIQEPGWKGLDWEYADSKQQIEAHIPGSRVRFLAFPGGTSPDPNDPAVASKYYVASRSTRGTLNGPYNIDYNRVNAMSGPTLDSPKTAFNDVRNLLNPRDTNYRGWAVLIYHLVRDRPGQQKFFDFYKQNAQDLWGAKFGDVALYGQERESATLKPGENSAARITFTLGDTKDDATFDYPLTLKVRLPDAWRGAAATQDGKATECVVVEHEGARYVLVKAVPDRGLVALQKR